MNSLLEDKLQELVRSGVIKDFKYEQSVLDETDREVDKLEIEFLSGEKLKLATFCSGCSEGSSIYLNEK